MTHFDRIADVYDETIPAHVARHYRARRAAFLLALAPGRRVIEVGCGTGLLAADLVQAGLDLVGVDPARGMLARARARGVRVVMAVGERLPVRTGAFDVAYNIAVLHHVAAKGAVREVVAEMARVVRPGGLVLVWDHNPRNPYWPFLMRRVPQDVGKERLISLEEIIVAFRSAGINPSWRRTGWMPDFVPPRAMPTVAFLERILERIPGLRGLSAHNVVWGRRPVI